MPLIVSGLLLGIMRNSTAGWNCQPSADGKWACSGTSSTGTQPARREQPLPKGTPADSVEEPAQPALPQRNEAETSEPTSRAYEPQPDGTPPAAAEESDQAGTSAKDEAEAAAPAPASNRSEEPDFTAGADSQTNREPLTESTSTSKAAEPRPYVSATVAAGASKTTENGEPDASEPAHTQPQDYTASHVAPTQEIEATQAEETIAAVMVDANIDRELDWNQCFPWTAPAPLSFTPAPAQQLLIDADGSILEQIQDQVRLEGRVEVRNSDTLLEADSVLYRRSAETLDADGNIYFERPGLRLSAAKAHFDLAHEQGELEQVSYRLSDQGARGDAGSARIESRDLSHFKQIDYTTCKPGNNGWLLEADELDIDQASGVGTARHAKLRFKGVPFLYTPYASFPIDDRRKSGFLFPSFGESDRSGTDIAVPYYFNIAPNMDATIEPRYLSKRGMLLGGEFRYLQAQHEGRIRAEILPDDSTIPDDENSTRGAFSYQANGAPAPGWTFDANVNYVSDNQYLDDLGESLAVTSTRHLERLGQVRYTGSDWSLLGRAQYFQTIDDTIPNSAKPYFQLPQFLFELYRPRQTYGLTYQLTSEFVNFGHSGSDIVKGQRFDLQPAISLPISRQWGYLTPKASVRYTNYSLDNQIQGADDSPDRLLPTLSVDGGLFFERNGNWFGDSIVHTLEPRLFYLVTPYEDQDELPNFDTADVTFSFASLFQENRFSGRDKIGDANQLTAALTSRILSDSTGAELLRASIGQIYYFRDRDVQISGGAPATESSSSVLAELASQVGREWSFRAGVQWDPHQGSQKTERGLLGMRYSDGANRIFNAEYNYTRDSVEQTDVSGRWPIGSRWSLVGRWTYSQLFEKTIQGFAGIEYDDCCWRVRLIGQQLLTDINDDPVNSVLVQFQLKGLGGLGSASDKFLEENISGYQAIR